MEKNFARACRAVTPSIMDIIHEKSQAIPSLNQETKAKYQWVYWIFFFFFFFWRSLYLSWIINITTFFSIFYWYVWFLV